MFSIDTSVASELMQPKLAATFAAWIAEPDAEDLFLTAISHAELFYGLASMPVGRRRAVLEATMNRWFDLSFNERFLPFESAASQAYAEIAVGRRRAGQPIGEADCQITAIPRSRGTVLVNRNIRNFEETSVMTVGSRTAAL